MIMIKTKNGWRPIASVAVNHNDCEGVFRPVSYEEAKTETMRRATDYERDVLRYINGELSLEQTFRSFSTPIFGAFGEKL